MVPDRERVRTFIAMGIEGEMVPFVSLCLIIAAVLVAGVDYSVLVEGSTLMFYAVLVGIWTSLAPDEPLRGGGTYAQFEFLMISTGAVIVGFAIEVGLATLSGQLYAVQALALIVVGTRLYVNSLDGVSLERTVRWHDKRDRYLVYMPCLVAIAIPIVVYWLPMTPPIALETPQGLLAVAGVGVAVGAVLFALDRSRQLAAGAERL